MAPVLREIYHLAVVGVAAAADLALYLAAIPIGEKRHLHLAAQLRTSMKAVIDEVEGSYVGSLFSSGLGS